MISLALVRFVIMLRKLVLYLLILNFLNTVLFAGESSDETPFDNKEEANIEEYNSMVEFVVEGCLEMPDKSPEDEDDDVPDGFKTEKQLDFYSPSFLTFQFFKHNAQIKHIHIAPHILDFSPEQNSPPPKF